MGKGQDNGVSVLEVESTPGYIKLKLETPIWGYECEEEMRVNGQPKGGPYACHLYTEDGQELARSLDIRFFGYAEAVEKILGSEAVTALLAGGEVAEFTVAESQGAQAQRLLSGLQSCTAGHQNTYCYSVDAQWAQEAHHLSLSCGKYRAFLEVQALYPDITPEEIQGMTMREIRTLLSGAGEEGQAASPPGHGGHGHHGAGHGWGATN